jgi:predicted MFS family arabinose efflux permease
VTEQEKNARYALAVLFSVNLMNFFDRQIAGALVEPIRLEFGLSDMQTGVINTAFTLVYAFVGVPLGRLTDTWARTKLIAIGVTFWSVLTAASGLAVNFWTYMLTRIGVGIGEASCAPAGQSLIGDMYPPERRARAMSIFMLGLPLGLFAAYMLSGNIAKAWGWRAAFFLACIPGLILAGLALLIREPKRGATEQQPMVVVQAPYRTVLSIPTIWWIILSGIMFNFNAYAVNVFQTAFLQRFHGLDIAQAANISAVSLGLVGVIGLLVGGWLGDRFRLPNRRLSLAAVGFLLAAPCAFFALQQPKGGIVVFGVLMSVFSMCTFMYYATVYSALQDVVPATLRGTTVSLYFFGQYVLGAAFGTTIMGALSDYFANKAMVEAGAALIEPFRAQGLHSAMYVIPLLSLLCAASLFGAARTVTADAKRMREMPVSAAAEPA